MFEIHNAAKIKYRKTCERCNSDFSFDGEEIIYYYKGSHKDQIDKIVNCPVCGYAMDVYTSDAVGVINDKHTSSWLDEFAKWLDSMRKEEDDD